MELIEFETQNVGTSLVSSILFNQALHGLEEFLFDLYIGIKKDISLSPKISSTSSKAISEFHVEKKHCAALYELDLRVLVMESPSLSELVTSTNSELSNSARTITS